MTTLEALWTAHERDVFKYANEQFEKYVKPYCKKNDYEFFAGNGTWWLTDWGKLLDEVADEVLSDENHPLYEILTEPVPGMAGNDVGSLMPDYRRS